MTLRHITCMCRPCAKKHYNADMEHMFIFDLHANSRNYTVDWPTLNFDHRNFYNLTLPFRSETPIHDPSESYWKEEGW